MGLEKVPEVLNLTIRSHTFNFPYNEVSKLSDYLGEMLGNWISKKIDQVFDILEQTNHENNR